jgi:hypothetical protein
MKSNNDLLIWLFIFILLALIFGLYIAENHRIPSALYTRTPGGAKTPYLEHYSSSSSSFDVSGGASSRYGWGVSESDDYKRKMLSATTEEKKSTCKSKSDGKEKEKCIQDDLFKSRSDLCKKCDILENEDIDKYVLKSSVPPCPNMSDYILKKDIPACPALAEIPKCPTCPELPANLRERKTIKNIQEFRITDVKDIEMLLQDQRIKEYLDDYYEKKNPIPVPNPQVKSTSIFGVHPEEEQQTSTEFIPTSTLMNEIKSLFGFGKSEKVEKVEKKSALKSYYQEEEEKSMVYNQNCTKPEIHEQNGMYAGDNLFSVANFS